MCIEVCRKQFYPFVVAPEEADSQVCKRSSAIAVGRDSDLLAYDNACVIIVDSYFTGDARVFNMNVPADEETCIKYPLYKYYRQHGVKVLRWFAAVCGCDVSVESVGMKGAGKAAFLLALSMLDSQGTTPLNSSSFACALKEAAATIPACNLEMTVQQIKAELDRVSRWFGDGGSFYDVDCNIRSVSWRIKHQRSEATKQHMQGKTDPKTGHQLTQEQLQTIQSVKSHNLLHNSATPTERVGRTSLPEGKTIETSNNDDLKRFIICRGGNLSVTGGNSMRKDELQKTVASYMSLDEEIPVDTATRFNRTRVNNGVFATIDVNEKRSANQIVDVLVSKGNEFEPHLHKLFLDVQQILHNGQFVEDFDAICLDAPECPEEFIWESFTNVGDSRDQKNIRDSLWKVLQYDEVVYHAFAWGPEKKSIYILSKQVASQKHDDKTGKPEEYFVMAHISVRETTEQSHGHTLGKCHMLMRSYCVKCKAGAGMCYHKGGLLWMQHLHWGEGRQCEKPSTAAWCPWVKGARAKRICSNVVPASNTHIERLPTSNAEAKKKLESGRKRNMHDGVPAKYDVFGGNESKRAALMDPTYTSHERWSGFFGALRNANNGRPCKAEIRYYGATDDGLTDIRCDVALWGTNTAGMNCVNHLQMLRRLTSRYLRVY
jgi:hypothetical protein